MTHPRLDQLADGIFAIVMTILVFEIRVPEVFGTVNDRILWMELEKLANPLLSYILSFSLLFTYWRAHHFFVSIYAKNVDLMLTNINLVFFMLVSLVPFSASFLGRFSESRLAVIVFGIHIILISLALYWMRFYVLYSDHIKNPEITHREIRGSVIRTLVPVVFAFLAILISTVNIQVSLIIFTLAVIFNLSSTSTRLFEKIFK